MRDFGEIIRRIDALPDAASRVLGEAAGYPIYSVTFSQDASRPVFFINGGTHGDEPAGVEGALAILEADQSRWLGHLHFEVIPCLIPTVMSTRRGTTSRESILTGRFFGRVFRRSRFFGGLSMGCGSRR